MSFPAINSFTSLQNERILNLGLDSSDVLCSVLRPGIMSRRVLPMWTSVTPGRFTPTCLLWVIVFCQVLWLSATVIVAVCSSWPGRSLLVSSRSVDPTGMCARQIILALELAPRQPGSCGWLVSLARRLSRGSPVALAEWGAGVLQGARPVCTGTNTLVHLAVWQHRTKDVQKLEWSREKQLEKKLNWSHVVPHVGAWTPTPPACATATWQHVINTDYLNFVVCRDLLQPRYITSVTLKVLDILADYYLFTAWWLKFSWCCKVFPPDTCCHEAGWEQNWKNPFLNVCCGFILWI